MDIAGIKEYLGKDWTAVQDCICGSLESDIDLLIDFEPGIRIEDYTDNFFLYEKSFPSYSSGTLIWLHVVLYPIRFSF